MTKQITKQKHDKQRAEKRKHEHETEEMAEHAARKRRAHVEETIAIIVMLTFVPFMVFGAIFWPGTTGSEGGNGGTGLQNGTYTLPRQQTGHRDADRAGEPRRQRQQRVRDGKRPVWERGPQLHGLLPGLQ